MKDIFYTTTTENTKFTKYNFYQSSIHQIMDTANYLSLSCCFVLSLLPCMMMVLVTKWKEKKNGYNYNRNMKSSNNKLTGLRKPTSFESEEDKDRIKRKDSFLKSWHGTKFYGYKTSSRGYIDTWRGREFPGLIQPIKGNKQSNQSQQNDLEVYLDYAGSSTPSLSLLTDIHNLSMKNQILANPHSSGIAASRSIELVEKTKMKILEFFDAQAGPLYGCSNVSNGLDRAMNASDYHPGYEIIFTSGATESLRIIAEHFKWTESQIADDNSDVVITSEKQGVNSCTKSVLVYPQNSHTSVIGMRECALAKGATFHCEKTSNILDASDDLFSKWESYGKQTISSTYSSNWINNVHRKEKDVNNLLVLPLECNFGGTRLINAKNIIQLSRQRSPPNSQKWYTVLDIAKAACSEHVNLREIDPDFACISFYKIFGHPTGIGALLVKRSSWHSLTPKDKVVSSLENKMQRNYFGGGGVDVVLPGADFVSLRSSVASLHHGTVNFRGIISLLPGFREIASLGGMKQVSCHTKSLAIEAVKRLNSLVHKNGRKAVVIYGAWSKYDLNTSSNDSDLIPGPTIAFNIVRGDGSFVGYSEVSKLASLYKTPIQLRIGCFCNPGACQEALCLSDDEIKVNYLKGKKVCGDENDLINGKPTGAVRLSFGKDSIWEDLDSAIQFLEKTFVSSACNFVVYKHQRPLPLIPREVFLSEIYVYPIKSCAGMLQELFSSY